MEIEFDKEIDAILRKARGGEVAASFDSHIDADEIAAFAENALSDLTRKRYTAHLADCTRCRKILSNVIALNSEAELETASSAVLPEIVEAKTPWYRKLFVFPQLAYTMGALVVLFSGFLGYVVFKNVSSGNSEVSYSTDKQTQMEKSAPQSAPTAFSNSNAATATNSTTTTTNSTSAVATNTTTTSATNSASVYSANKSVTDAPTEKKSDLPEISATPSINQPTTLPAPKPQDLIVSEDDKDLAKAPTKNEVQKPNAAAELREQKKILRDTEDSYSANGQSTADSTAEKQKAKKMRSTPQISNLPLNGRKTESEAGATRSVSGKTFNNVGGIWFDSAVGKQKQKTVKRGSKDYQKLDSGLRSIADQFGGTVVILWNGKAYRIQ